MKVYRYLPYFLIPIFLIVYETATLIVMNVYSLNSILVSHEEPQNSFIAMFWFDGINNVYFILLCAALIVLMLLYLNPIQSYVRIFFIIFSSLGIGYYAFYYWATVMASPYVISAGQSGVAMAIFGLIIGMYIPDLFVFIRKKGFYNAFLVLTALITTVILIYSSPVLFFDEFTNVLFQVHILAFEYGIIVGILFALLEGSFLFALGGGMYETVNIYEKILG